MNEINRAPKFDTSQPSVERSDDILDRLLSLHPKSIDLSLGRLERLLSLLGRPERQLPPIVHVAGTNGKGSVCAYLRAGLEAAVGAQNVHVYTSPHLVRFHERIRVNGDLIDEGELSALLAECEEINAGEPITFYEITTAAAILAFARNSAKWCVMEVGLGGRLDATNVVKPHASVITPVSLDHQDFLGSDLASIAREKAGIIKPGAPVICARQQPEALREIESAADRLGAHLYVQDQEWTVREENGRLVYEDEQGLMDLPPPSLFGRHQMDNAGVAVASMRVLGLDEDACAAAMQYVAWPARLHRLRRGDLVDLLPADAELWLDGGHNAAAAAVVAEHMADAEDAAPSPLYLVVGMLSSKDAESFLRPFAGLTRRVFAVSIPDEPGAHPADVVAQAAVRSGMSAQVSGSVEGALRAVMIENRSDIDSGPPRILICGSLHLAGHVLRGNS